MEKETFKPKKSGSANINDWARAIRERYPQLAELSQSLDEDKLEGIRGIEELDLPRFKRIETTLSDFLDLSGEYFKEVGSKKFYISLLPRKKDMERFGKADLTNEEALEYIRKNINPEDFENYNVVLQQYFDNLYGGNIVVGPERKNFLVEFKKGMMSGIASGYKTPEYTIERNAVGVFQYSFEDPEMRKIMHDAVMEMPHSGMGSGANFTEGYYEFAVVKDDDGLIRPIFTDYRKNPRYQPAWEKLGPNEPRHFEPDE